MDEEELGSINVELRYITLELMKIAERNGRQFNEVAEEYVRNVNTLHRTINSSSGEKAKAEEKKFLHKL